jgi:cytochrome c oxidase accessory protein FixG
MGNLRLPIVDQPGPSPNRAPGSGSLGKDGRRRRPYPADVSGRWVRARRIVYFSLIAIWAVLPWIPVGGHPAVFLDVERRQFFLFGATFNAQDIWLLFFAVTGFGFGLLYLTALLGRVWCGWACPQTVFIEGIFRPLERLVNGPRNTALERKKRPVSFDSLWRLVLTHALYLLAAAFAAHVFLAYFVSLPALYAMIRSSPGKHPEAFAWMLGSTALFYVAFGIFREQFCVVMCPYGRLQSVLLDDDALVIGYDERRGEPRGKAKTAARGDCVDCNRCVVVCPTGIDIREGLQLDCIACTACIDACDDVMDRLGQPRGLIRYDSLRGLRGEKRRILRPTIIVYTVLLVIGIVVAALAIHRRDPFEANVLRLPGAPYTRDAGKIRNGYELHLVNKGAATATFSITPMTGPELEAIVPMQTVEIEPLGSRRLPFFVTMEASRFSGDRPIVVRVESGGVHKDATTTFLGAKP